MLGLCCRETYVTMTNYNDGDENEKKDGNDNENAVYGPGSDGPIFDSITTPWYHGGGSGDDDEVALATA